MWQFITALRFKKISKNLFKTGDQKACGDISRFLENVANVQNIPVQPMNAVKYRRDIEWWVSKDNEPKIQMQENENEVILEVECEMKSYNDALITKAFARVYYAAFHQLKYLESQYEN